MKLNLKIVGKNKTEILETMQELLDVFWRDFVFSNCATTHDNGTISDYDFTDGNTLLDEDKELCIRP